MVILWVKRPRPYIPIAVRLVVAQRQHRERYPMSKSWINLPDGTHLELLLVDLFPNPPAQLDHDPALILRKFNRRTGKYTPDANDPEFLVYREKADHQQKTTGRKPGAERTITTKGSDMGLKAKFARLEGRTKKKPKREIPVRKNPWPKRKFR